jgi:hypothetical protein
MVERKWQVANSIWSSKLHCSQSYRFANLSHANELLAQFKLTNYFENFRKKVVKN